MIPAFLSRSTCWVRVSCCPVTHDARHVQAPLFRPVVVWLESTPLKGAGTSIRLIKCLAPAKSISFFKSEKSGIRWMKRRWLLCLQGRFTTGSRTVCCHAERRLTFFCAKHAALNATGFDVSGSSAHWQLAGLGPRESRESVQPQSFVCSESCFAYKLICVSVH